MSQKITRRKFLAAVGVGGAAAAAVATTRNGEQRTPEQSQALREGQGYQVTAHVRRYYETTKV